MEKRVIITDKAPAAIGPYSQAVVSGDLAFISGQLPINPKTGDVPASVEEQTKLVMENIKGILSSISATCTLENIVKTTIFLKDMNDFVKVNEVYGSYFKSSFPARATVEVARLPKDVRVEIESIARIS